MFKFVRKSQQPIEISISNFLTFYGFIFNPKFFSFQIFGYLIAHSFFIAV